MSVLLSVLSHNHISVLGEQSFRNLPVLHTLLLDHNLLTSQALQGGALTNLTRLEVLALGHNLIRMVGTSSWGNTHSAQTCVFFPLTLLSVLTCRSEVAGSKVARLCGA